MNIFSKMCIIALSFAIADNASTEFKTSNNGLTFHLEPIEEVYEPYLIKEGYVQRTTRGRIALDKAYQYCNKKKHDNQDQINIL